ncbi:ribosome maturation factor RimP [Peptoniphilus asaccharolyticus DSM 20463]|uniref:Ribosome maturation factor RimP n=1 Tax=Peptoniphilus asaccharolyticus DSM 20463 TaxID=573058 RepID=A0A1W1URN1_PEPAS|nr:ribosome maturation factor RimP [Peptoniphilus asaccharolyticus]MBL7575108.1 ribosome maturation factor RimP [Peptoniphilus asaccharolyticus]SMB83788.1 ribosome maturation factor RimP [Peptoniphilus asaccharolyticus DSM 20463]
MSKKEIIAKIKEIAQRHADELGYELVDIEYKVGNKHDLLSIFIYREGGIDLEDCSNMSRAVDDEVEKLDIIENPYYLEISSPGLDRPLKTEADYRRNIGKEVTIKLYAPIDGKKQIEGVLSGYDSECVQIEIESENINIPIKSIANMVQTIKF